MKKITLLVTVATLFFASSIKAQIQRGNLLIGADLADFNLGLNSGNGYDILINPRLAYFIKDGLAVGPYVTLGLQGAKHIEPTTLYGVGALGRYYVSDTVMNLLKHGRFFVEANAGIQGNNNSENDETTNGLGLGIGPGYAYFITPNVGLETLLKYNGIIGFGSSVTTSNLRLSLGFQIYLGSKRAREIITNPNQ
jgi:hypothetical protein